MIPASGKRFILAFFGLCHLACDSYRVQYREEFYVEQAKSEEKIGPFTFLYEDNFSTGFLWWACPLTFIYYGGVCWVYFGLPYASDVTEIEKQAQAKLKLLLDGRRMKSSAIEIKSLGSSHVELESRLRIFNSNRETILRGYSLQINSAPAEMWSNEFGDGSYESDDWIDLAEAQIPQAPDTSYSYTATQISILSGVANVESYVSENGVRSKIASGQAQHQLFELRTRTLNPTGYYWSYSPHYSVQNIKIQDYAAQLPQVEIADSENIPVVVTDPISQQEVPLETYTNAYRIQISNIGVLLGGGYNQTYKSKHQDDFWSMELSGWLGLLNYFKTEVEFQQRHARKSYFDFLSGAKFELNIFRNFTKQKLALGFHYNYLIFPKIELADDVEFRGRVRYRSDAQIFERSRVFVKDLNYNSSVLGLSLSYIFQEYRSP